VSALTEARKLLARRREAVADGELAHMWPGAAWDLITSAWFRGVGDHTWRPLLRRLRGPGPDERYHSPTGGCPQCNPSVRP
jgi:hypothetical protein